MQNICLNLQNVSVKGVAYIPSTAKLMNGFYAPFYKIIMGRFVFLKEQICFNKEIEIDGRTFNSPHIFVKRASWHNERWLIDWFCWSIQLDLSLDVMYYFSSEDFDQLKEELKEDIEELSKNINVAKFNFDTHIGTLSREELLNRMKEVYDSIKDIDPEGDFWIHVT